MLPELSILIPSHSRPDLLRACLASVIQFAPEDTETLVIDDGSSQAAVSRVAQAFPGVRALRLQRQRGFCAAVNAGIHAARGRFVEVLNDDTEVTAGWADAALARFSNPAVAAVAPLVLYHSASQPEIIDSAGDRYYCGGIAGKRGHDQPLDATYAESCQVFGASASSAFYRREVLLGVGAFPDSFGSYFEDVDLAFRLHWAGYKVEFEPASRVLHHVSASYGRPGRKLLEQQSRNEERVFWRNLPRRLLLRALPHHVAVLAAKARRRWHEGTLVPFLCGRLRVLAEVGALRHYRTWLQNLGTGEDHCDWHLDWNFSIISKGPAMQIKKPR